MLDTTKLLSPENLSQLEAYNIIIDVLNNKDDEGYFFIIDNWVGNGYKEFDTVFESDEITFHENHSEMIHKLSCVTFDIDENKSFDEVEQEVNDKQITNFINIIGLFKDLYQNKEHDYLKEIVSMCESIKEYQDDENYKPIVEELITLLTYKDFTTRYPKCVDLILDIKTKYIHDIETKDI